MKTINLGSTVKTRDHDGYKASTFNEKMWMLTKEQEDLVCCMTPEGPSDDFSWKIVLINFFTGEEYVLNHLIVGKLKYETYEDKESGYSEDVCYYKNGRSCADEIIEKIKAKSVVNLEYWVKIK